MKDIKFPSASAVKVPRNRDPFPKTMAAAVLACVAALLLGMFLGSGIGAFFGTNESILTTTTFTDYMGAIKVLFTNDDQIFAFQQVAQETRSMDGLKLLSSRDGRRMLAYWDGNWVPAEDVLTEDSAAALTMLMQTDTALAGQEDSNGNAYSDIRCWNIAVKDRVVYFYEYYNAAGYVGIAYDDTNTVLAGQKEMTLELAVDEGVPGGWYLVYDMEDV